MRSTLLASCLLALTFTGVGCDDAKKTEPAADSAPVVKPNPEPGKDGMDAPKGAMEAAPKGGAMEGPAAAPAAPAATEPAAEPKKEETPKS